MPLCTCSGRYASFLKGRGTEAFSLWQRAPYEEIVHFYWSISRAPRQWQGATEAIASVASVKYQACMFQLFCLQNSKKNLLRVAQKYISKTNSQKHIIYPASRSQGVTTNQIYINTFTMQCLKSHRFSLS